MSNQLTAKKPTFSMAITTEKFQNTINRALQDPERARRFTSAVISAVYANPALQECDAGTIVSAALLGEGLNLSPSPQLGQYYLVPFNDNKHNRKVAQFQLGYKGYIQLAIRSGYYKKLNVMAVKKDELVKFDPLNEEIEVNLIQDELEREQAETIGYYAMFEYQNGFKKALYWSKSKMQRHAEQYSKGYKARKGYTFWEKDFDGMAFKTMLRQLISKWGIMSIEMQDVYSKDMAVINDDGTPEYPEYIEGTSNEIEPQTEPEGFGEPETGSLTEEENAPVSLDDI